MWPTLPEAASYSSVHAKKDPLVEVNVSKEPYSAQNFAPVVQDATICQHEFMNAYVLDLD